MTLQKYPHFYLPPPKKKKKQKKKTKKKTHTHTQKHTKQTKTHQSKQAINQNFELQKWSEPTYI